MRPVAIDFSGSRFVPKVSSLLVLLACAIAASPAWSEDVKDKGAVPGVPLSKEAMATPTHHQTAQIKVDVPGMPKATLKCFCLTPDQRILAGCEIPAGEIRVFDASGKFLEKWTTVVKPEAIYAREDGTIFVAGEGQLLKLSAKGAVLLQREAPHAAAMTKNLDSVRAEVIAQNKQTAEMYTEQAKVYDTALAGVEQQITTLKAQIAVLEKPKQAEGAAKGEADAAAAAQTAARNARQKTALNRQLQAQEQMKTQYEQAKSQFAEVIKQLPTGEPTEAQIKAQVQASIQSKLAASSISATKDRVYLATRGAVGYGFDVLRTDNEFASAERIVSNLSGCCGQMDVKVNEDGMFVAENSHHRVCHYDANGKLIETWGKGARTGLEGFGSCCNPMNVTFGKKGVVYTSEDDTGRIKRYSPDGKLLGLVGSVDLVPGCKNVSIAVTPDESHVYMLDITHGHIVHMEPYGPGEKPRPVPYDEQPEAAAGAGVTFEASQTSSTSGGNIIVQGLKALFGG